MGKYSKDQIQKLRKIKNVQKIMHNYYPPPKEPFCNKYCFIQQQNFIQINQTYKKSYRYF